MEGKDRNTLLLIVIILVISVISLIVVITLSWRVAGDTVINIFDFFTENIELRNTDYNFEIPESE